MQRGLTLVELMISMVLGMFVVMAATALFLSAKSGYATEDEMTRIQDTGRYALESITRAVRQTAFENWDREEGPIVAMSTVNAPLAGFDASSLKSKAEGIVSPVNESINGSDVLSVRFFGAGSGDNGDYSVINCAGFGVPAASNQESANEARGWSIFYVAKDATGEPELYCKFRGNSGWTSQAIARGIESFQALYGLDTDGDALPNRFVTATMLNTLDDALVLEGADAEAKEADKNKKTNWKKVVVIKVALLIRGSQKIRADTLSAEYDLFGKEYSEEYASTDTGTKINETDLPKAVRNRLRKVFNTTIQLRNQASGQ